MSDENKPSPAELKARLQSKGAWGLYGNAAVNRYMVPAPKRRGRRPKCHCGCGGPVTHVMMSNGVCLSSGCELSARRWVRCPEDELIASIRAHNADWRYAAIGGANEQDSKGCGGVAHIVKSREFPNPARCGAQPGPDSIGWVPIRAGMNLCEKCHGLRAPRSPR